MKKINLLTILMCMFALTIFTGCSKDDDEVTGESKALVGNWLDDSYLICLKSNGRYTAYEYVDLDASTYEDTWSGKWSYDKEDKILTMTWENTNEIEDEYEITSISEDKIIAGRTVFVRIPDSKVPKKYQPSYDYDD